MGDITYATDRPRVQGQAKPVERLQPFLVGKHILDRTVSFWLKFNIAFCTLDNSVILTSITGQTCFQTDSRVTPLSWQKDKYLPIANAFLFFFFTISFLSQTHVVGEEALWILNVICETISVYSQKCVLKSMHFPWTFKVSCLSLHMCNYEHQNYKTDARLCKFEGLFKV